jgi:hypothetical protein
MFFLVEFSYSLNTQLSGRQFDAEAAKWWSE